MKHGGVWVSKGIIANYNRLKDYAEYMDTKTEKFLKEIYNESFDKAGFARPYYLNNSRYSLYDNLLRNRAMIFNELIGTSRDSLCRQMKAINISPNPDKDYNYLVKDYLIAIKSGY